MNGPIVWFLALSNIVDMFLAAVFVDHSFIKKLDYKIKQWRKFSNRKDCRRLAVSLAGL